MMLLLVLLLLVSITKSQIVLDDILKELNMTMIELFPNLYTYDMPSVSYNTSSSTTYTYTYKISTATFKGPSFDNSGDINVVGCSGLQNVNYCGSGECRNNVNCQVLSLCSSSLLSLLPFINMISVAKTAVQFHLAAG